VRSAEGYGTGLAGERLLHAWRIDRVCPADACSFVLTRTISGGPPLTAALVPEPEGWHATFPDRAYPCGRSGGMIATWPQHSTRVVRFLNDGTIAEAHERNVSFAPACGWGTDAIDWAARRIPTRASGTS
jgi:hypothetical protein